MKRPAPALERQLALWIGLSILLHLALAAGVWYGNAMISTPPHDLEVEWVFLATPPGPQAPPAQAETPVPLESPPPAMATVPRRPQSPSATAQPAPPAHPGPASPAPAVPPERQVETPKTSRQVANLMPKGWQIPSGSTGADAGRHGAGGGDGTLSSTEETLGSWGDGTHRGTGLVPIPVVKEQIKEEGKRVVAEDRVARGLVSPETNAISTRLESAWNVTRQDVRRWPVRPETRVEYFTPEGMDQEIPGGSCTYQRYSLALVRIVVDRDGSLVSARVARSSGSRRWDREALDLIRRAAPFPPPPSSELDANGTVASTWDVGVRDYSMSSCFFFHRNKLVKDIVLLGEY